MLDASRTSRVFRPLAEFRYFGAVACVIAVCSALFPALVLIVSVISLPLAILGGGLESALTNIAICVSLLVWSAALLRWGLRVWNRVPSSGWTVMVGFVLFGAMVVASKYFKFTGIPPPIAQGLGTAGVLGVFVLSRLKEPAPSSEPP